MKALVLAVFSLLALWTAGIFFMAGAAGLPSWPTPEVGPKGGNPRIQPALAELAARLDDHGPDAAASFAAENALRFTEGRVQVVLETADSPEDVIAAVKAAGGEIETSHRGLIQAQVPVEALEALSGLSQVSLVREPRRPTLSTVSEGAADAGVTSWHAAGNTGASAKVAVLDPGFAGYTQRIAEGELPANLTAVSFAGNGDITGGGVTHGTACAEIVYDLAPGAQLYLINFGTDVELAAVLDYVVAQDIDVVSASWGFYGAFRGDGQGYIDDMVADATASGIFWANASGNSAQTHWSGNYTDTDADGWHEFAAGDPGNDIVVSSGSTIDVFMTWNKWPVTDQDYDMYLVYENGNQTVAAGDGWQGGAEEPAEELHYTVPPGKSGRYWVVISNYSATGDADLHLYTYPNTFQYQVAAGSLGGQPADSASVMTVGAVPAGSSTIEYFSSRGPTRDGRIKPDIVSTDRVSTVTYGFQGFWGTSAAAPHVAAAGALVIGAMPGSTPAEVQSLLESRATPLGTSGKDNIYGSGKLRMGESPDTIPPAIASVSPSGDVSSTSAVVTVSYSDPGGGIDTSSVNVTLDGAALSGCTVTQGDVSCPVSGLSSGAHAIGGSVADLSGNVSQIEGSFTVTCGKPDLSASTAAPYWASFDDYQARELSLDWTFANIGSSEAVNITLVGNVNTNSVIAISSFPMEPGNIAAGSSATVTIQYKIPAGVSNFRTVTYATAEDICGIKYYYPAPYLEN